jgi:hypothetical protein
MTIFRSGQQLTARGWAALIASRVFVVPHPVQTIASPLASSSVCVMGLRLPGLLPQSALLLAAVLMRLVCDGMVRLVDFRDFAFPAGPGDVGRAEDAPPSFAGSTAAWVKSAHFVPSICGGAEAKHNQ